MLISFRSSASEAQRVSGCWLTLALALNLTHCHAEIKPLVGGELAHAERMESIDRIANQLGSAVESLGLRLPSREFVHIVPLPGARQRKHKLDMTLKSTNSMAAGVTTLNPNTDTMERLTDSPNDSLLALRAIQSTTPASSGSFVTVSQNNTIKLNTSDHSNLLGSLGSFFRTIVSNISPSSTNQPNGTQTATKFEISQTILDQILIDRFGASRFRSNSEVARQQQRQQRQQQQQQQQQQQKTVVTLQTGAANSINNNKRSISDAYGRQQLATTASDKESESSGKQSIIETSGFRMTKEPMTKEAMSSSSDNKETITSVISPATSLTSNAPQPNEASPTSSPTQAQTLEASTSKEEGLRIVDRISFMIDGNRRGIIVEDHSKQNQQQSRTAQTVDQLKKGIGFMHFG